MISSDCPQNHSIEFFAEYWLPEYPFHIIKQGKIKIEVSGKDVTTPILRWVRVPGDNIIRAKVYDGSKIQYVSAKCIFKNDPKVSFQVELKDDGAGGDKVGGDNVFTKAIPRQKFGLYRMVIEAIGFLWK